MISKAYRQLSGVIKGLGARYPKNQISLLFTNLKCGVRYTSKNLTIAPILIYLCLVIHELIIHLHQLF